MEQYLKDGWQLALEEKDNWIWSFRILGLDLEVPFSNG